MLATHRFYLYDITSNSLSDYHFVVPEGPPLTGIGALLPGPSVPSFGLPSKKQSQ